MSAVRIELQVGGVSDVRTAFRSIEQEVARAQKQQSRTGDGGTAAVKRGASEQAKAWKAAGKEAEKSQREAQKAQDRTAKEAERTAQRIARAEAQSAAAGIRETERAEKAKTREAAKGAADRERLQKRVVSERFKDMQREADNEQRLINKSSQSFRQNALGRVGRTMGGALTQAGRLAYGALTFGGQVNVGDAIRDRMSLEDVSRTTANTAYMPGVKGAGRVDWKDVASQSRAIEAATNVKAPEAAEAIGKYLEKASDPTVLQKGNPLMMNLMKLGKAEGIDMNDMMTAAGTLKMQNRGLNDEQMMNMMRSVVGQGKLGAVKMADMAKVMPRVSASASWYQGDQGQNQTGLLGLMQLSMATTGSASRSATAIANLAPDVLKHREALEQIVGKGEMSKLFDKQSRLADPATVVSTLIDKSGGDVGKIQKVLGARSIGLANDLLPIYNDAEKNERGSGKQAVIDEIKRNTGANYSKEDVETDFASKMASTSAQFESAVLQMKNALADQLMPVVTDLAKEMPEFLENVKPVIKELGWLAQFLMAHPFAGIGIAAAAAVSKDIAAAAIGNVIKSLLTGGGGGAGSLGALGKGAAAVGIVGAGAMLAYEAETAHLDANDKRNGGYSVAGVGAAGLAARLGSGRADPETIKAAQAEATKLGATIADQKAHQTDGLDSVAKYIPGLGEAAKTNQAARDQAIKSNESALKALTDALNRVAANPPAARSAPMTHADRGGPGT